MRCQNWRSRSSRNSGGLPAMMAPLMAPTDVPITQSGLVHGLVDAELISPQRAAALQHQHDLAGDGGLVVEGLIQMTSAGLRLAGCNTTFYNARRFPSCRPSRAKDQAACTLRVARRKSTKARTLADRWRFCGYKIENGRERPAWSRSTSTRSPRLTAAAAAKA